MDCRRTRSRAATNSKRASLVTVRTKRAGYAVKAHHWRGGAAAARAAAERLVGAQRRSAPPLGKAGQWSDRVRSRLCTEFSAMQAAASRFGGVVRFCL